MDKASCVLGIDVGGTRIRMGLVDEGFQLHRETSLFLSSCVGGIRESLARLIREYICDAGEEYTVRAISLGIPGTVSKDKSTIISAPNVPELDSVPLKEALEEVFQVPVFLERDVNNLLCFDAAHFQIPESGTVIAIYLGTGIGNAVRIDGKLLTGRWGAACELGHIPLYGNRLRCVCGNDGCIETVASGKYLAELCEKEFGDPDIPHVFCNHGAAPEIQAFVEALAISVSTEINIFDPDHVIIGGGVPAMEGFPLDRFEGHIRSHIRKPYPADGLQFLYATSDPFSGVRGAGMRAYEILRSRAG